MSTFIAQCYVCRGNHLRQGKEKAGPSLILPVIRGSIYLLNRLLIPINPSKPEPMSHTAGGMGTGAAPCLASTKNRIESPVVVPVGNSVVPRSVKSPSVPRGMVVVKELVAAVCSLS